MRDALSCEMQDIAPLGWTDEQLSDHLALWTQLLAQGQNLEVSVALNISDEREPPVCQMITYGEERRILTDRQYDQFTQWMINHSQKGNIFNKTLLDW